MAEAQAALAARLRPHTSLKVVSAAVVDYVAEDLKAPLWEVLRQFDAVVHAWPGTPSDPRPSGIVAPTRQALIIHMLMRWVTWKDYSFALAPSQSLLVAR